MKPKLLIVDDCLEIRTSSTLAMHHVFECFEAGSLADAKALLATTKVDAVLLDMSLEDAKEAEGLDFFLEHYPSLPVVIHSANPTGADLVCRGASAFILKGSANLEQTIEIVTRAITEAK